MTMYGVCRFNEEVFGNQLPANMEIVWKKRLTTTAGRMVYRTDHSCVLS